MNNANKMRDRKTDIDHSELVELYRQGENQDQPLYSEQRSNLMLVAGNHYTRKGSKFWNRIRDDRGLSRDMKIRITKNHLQRICKIYENNILSYAPGVDIGPKNMSELQDQKAAELNNSVWADICTRHRMKQRDREFVQDFVRIGEVFCKIFWDPTKGKFMGYEQPEISPEDLEGLDLEDIEMDEDGQPIIPGKEKLPKFSGDLVFERIYGFNVFRSKEAKSLEESWFLGFRKMSDVEDLKKRIIMESGDPNDERLHYIQPTRNETYLIFDGNNTTYTEATNQCLLLEMFIRPCPDYPKGYFFIYTLEGILWKGELPFGIWPIANAGFDEVPTNPRCHAIIKQLRPYQAELNRQASCAAETQVTIGQDKVFIQAGTKLQNGGTLPGVNAYTIAGNPPAILPGRTGEQWFQPIKDTIAEMYQVANLDLDSLETNKTQDPYSLLFMTIEQKKKYMIYATKIEQFLVDKCDIGLRLMKEYATPDMTVAMIGRSEMVNIAEFKSTNPMNHVIRIESGTEDMESKMGRQLMFNHVTQYLGNQLDPKQIGRLIRTSPYANNEEAFDELTIDYDNGTNMLLALDRGEQFRPDPNDDSAYMMKRLVARIRRPDFKMLNPQAQNNYMQVKQAYEQLAVQQQQQIAAAAQGFIPMSGMAVVCDLYVPDPSSPNKTQRARVPYDSLVWLLQRIEKQGMSQQALAEQQQGVVADIARQLSQNPHALQQALQNGQPRQPNGGQAGAATQPPLMPNVR